MRRRGRFLFTGVAWAVLSLSQATLADVDAGLAALSQRDYITAAKEFESAANQGNVQAQYSLGHMYDAGQGLPQDYSAAAKWYRKAAEQGFDLAQNNLGLLYENGRGLAQDFAEAANWYRKAAEQGYALAQFNLGGMYAKGQGVAQDDVQAYFWTMLAALQGDHPASDSMKFLAGRMTPEQMARAQEQVAERLRQQGGVKPTPPVGPLPGNAKERIVL